MPDLLQNLEELDELELCLLTPTELHVHYLAWIGQHNGLVSSKYVNLIRRCCSHEDVTWVDVKGTTKQCNVCFYVF